MDLYCSNTSILTDSFRINFPIKIRFHNSNIEVIFIAE